MKTSETETVGEYVSCWTKQERVSLLLLLLPKYMSLLTTTPNQELLESVVDQLEENK